MIDNDTLYRIANANYSNPYADVIPFALGVGYPIVRYNGFMLQNQEVILYVAPASVYNDKEKVVGYTGSSAGVSVRVAKGVSVRTGGSKSKAVRNNVREYTDGDLIITNKRVVFTASKNSFEMKINKITATKILTRESFILQAGNTAKNLYLNEALNFYVCAMINHATDSFAQGIDMYEECNIVQNNMSIEHQQLCINTRQQISTLKIAKKKKTTTVLPKVFGIVMSILFVIIIVALVIPKNANSTSDSEQEIVLSHYSDKELVLMDNHPRIFDDLASVESYIKQLNDARVNVVYTQEGKTQTTDGKKPYKKAVITYDRHSSNHDYVGCFTIDIKDSDYSRDMTVETAVEVALTYLPQNFKDLYKCDSAYIRETDNAVIYTYAMRLNENGIEYHNNGNKQYSNYLSLYIIDYTDSNRWVIESDYAAYGNKDKGWIEKYATPWDIQLINNP